MGKALSLCVALTLVCGAAYGVGYSWIPMDTNNAYGFTWDDTTNWNPTAPAGGPNSAADTVRIGSSGKVDLTASTPSTFTLGELIVDNDSTLYQYSKTIVWNIQDDCGHSGDFVWRSVPDPVNYQTHITWNVDGHLILDYGGSFHGNYGGQDVINMYGTNKALKNTGGDYGTECTVNIYGSVYDNGSSTGFQNNNALTVKSGAGLLNRADGLPSRYGDPATFRYSCIRTETGSADLVVKGGLTYPYDVEIGANWWSGYNPTTEYLWQIQGGDIVVGRDLEVQNWGGNSQGEFWLTTTDKDGGPDANLTINGNLDLGSSSSIEFYGVRLNSSTVRVGDSILVGTSDATTSGGADLGSATIYLGDDLTFRRPSAWTINNWDPGTSTLICDGNGMTTVGRQTLRTWGDCGIALNNLIIDSPRTVELYNTISPLHDRPERPTHHL